ncbi:MAG TPA: methyltransferase domain-containing protein [Pirellulales bacterium]|nr:methyltransferase domain-containing protein [Pirellulales bacterium]
MNYLEDIDYATPDFGDFYDELPLWSAPFGRMLLEHVVLRRGMTILDVGAGTGFVSIELAQRCGPDAHVIAVDPWEAAVSRLNRKLKRWDIRNVRTVLSDVVAIDLPDSSVDLIVSNLGINNFDRPEAALRSCLRVAKPGADLFLTTNLVGHMAEFYEVYRGVLVELGLHHRIAPLEEHIRHRATIDSLRSLLESAGFEFVEAITGTFKERFADGTALLEHRFVRLGFLSGWKSVAEDAVAATFAALEQRLNDVAAERGELSLTIPAACVHACKPAAG